MAGAKQKKQLTDELISVVKNDATVFMQFVAEASDSQICTLLEKLGRINEEALVDPLKVLLQSNSSKVRTLAVKNLGKLKQEELLEIFQNLLKTESVSEVRRETVSAIGRLRSLSAIPLLKKLTLDKDPNIVMQAARGLLVFKGEKLADDALKNLTKHPNEQVREMIERPLTRKPSRSTQVANRSKLDSRLTNVVVSGDTRKILQVVPDETFHLTFTSPPYYNARDYSIYQSYEEYLEFLEQVFREVHRTTQEGRFLIINTSPIIIPRISRAHASRRYPIPFDMHSFLSNMGWEYIDDIVWLKPEASVKNRIGGFLQHRKPLGYKPNAVTEMLMVYRKKTDKLLDWNMRQYSDEVVKSSLVDGDFESTNVWRIDPVFDKTHSAVFPIALCDRIVKYYSYVGDLILDPFAGSGTLGRSANNLGRNFFLTEQEPVYIERMKDTFLQRNPELFEERKSIQFLDLKRFSKLVKEEL